MFRSGCAEGRAGGGMLRHPHARLAAQRVPAGVAEEEEAAEEEEMEERREIEEKRVGPATVNDCRLSWSKTENQSTEFCQTPLFLPSPIPS